MAKLNDPLWQRLFDELVVLARKNLGHLPQHVQDEEDIATSAIKSFFRGVEKGRFQVPQDDGFSLLPLLSLIAARKCADLAAYLKAQKRDVSKVTEAELDQIIGKGDPPSLILEHEEGRQRLLEAIPDERLRQMAQWKMDGFTNKEIAEKLGLVERSVERGITLIRDIWAKYVKTAY